MSQRDFNHLADNWDKEPRRQLLAADIAAGIKQSVPLNDNMRLLDYGCGTGLVAMHLLPHVGHLTGLDSSPGMLSVFKSKLSEEENTRVTLHVLDLADGGTFSGTYDVIIAAMLLHHVDVPSDLIRRLAGHLSPGGYLCLADLDSEDGSFHDDPIGVHHFGFDRNLVSAWMSDAGLSTASITTVSTIQKQSPGGPIRNYQVFLAVSPK